MFRSAPKTGVAAATSIALAFSLAGIAFAAASRNIIRVRLAFSDTLFADLNETDASIAVRAWLASVGETSSLAANGNPQVLGSEQMVNAITHHLVDVFSITTPEYARVAHFVDPVVFMDGSFEKTGVEYVLLVRQDSGIQELSGLRGRSLVTYRNLTTILSSAWLKTLLAGSNLEPPERLFSRISNSVKIAQSVLPVYFGRIDACLVTRKGFDTMSELNPQLRQKLRILAASPKLMVGLVGVHKDASDEMKGRIREALVQLHDTPSGRQLLTLFYCERMVAVDSSMMHGSVDLEAAYDRLKLRRLGGNK